MDDLRHKIKTISEEDKCRMYDFKGRQNWPCLIFENPILIEQKRKREAAEKQRLAEIEFEQKRAAYNAKIREERKLKRENLKLKIQQYIQKINMIDKYERKFYISLITAVALIIFIFFTFFRYEYKNDGVIIIKTDRITGSSEIIRPQYHP